VDAVFPLAEAAARMNGSRPASNSARSCSEFRAKPAAAPRARPRPRAASAVVRPSGSDDPQRLGRVPAMPEVLLDREPDKRVAHEEREAPGLPVSVEEVPSGDDVRDCPLHETPEDERQRLVEPHERVRFAKDEIADLP